jgi:hypothetical protein
MDQLLTTLSSCNFTSRSHVPFFRPFHFLPDLCLFLIFSFLISYLAVISHKLRSLSRVTGGSAEEALFDAHNEDFLGALTDDEHETRTDSNASSQSPMWASSLLLFCLLFA